MNWTKRKYDKGTVGHTSAKKGRFTYDFTDPKGDLLGFVLTDEGGRFCASVWLGDHWKDCGIHIDLDGAQRSVEHHLAKEAT